MIDGGSGNDVMTGGLDNDTFVASSGADYIKDFTDDVDTIDLAGTFASTSDVSSYLTANAAIVGGTDTVISLGGGNFLTIENVNDYTILYDDII